MNEAKKATPRKELMRQLLDSNEPKTTREHAAVRTIEELLEALEALAEQVAYRSGDNECRPLENALAAIAKARGKA